MPYLSRFNSTPLTLAGLGGLGSCTCDANMDTCADGSDCILSSQVAALPGGQTGPNAGLVSTGTGTCASTDTACLAAMGIVTPVVTTAPAASTFLDWVDANSTLLVVGIAAAGFLLALMSGGRRR